MLSEEDGSCCSDDEEPDANPLDAGLPEWDQDSIYDSDSDDPDVEYSSFVSSVAQIGPLVRFSFKEVVELKKFHPEAIHGKPWSEALEVSLVFFQYSKRMLTQSYLNKRGNLAYYALNRVSIIGLIDAIIKCAKAFIYLVSTKPLSSFPESVSALNQSIIESVAILDRFVLCSGSVARRNQLRSVVRLAKKNASRNNRPCGRITKHVPC